MVLINKKRGADDLLPILSYIIVKSNVKNFYSELEMISDFVKDNYLKGELCYYLVSFQTAISFIDCLDNEQVCFILFYFRLAICLLNYNIIILKAGE